MKEVGSRTEGVEVLTVTEADDGTRSDTIESVREQMIKPSEERKACCLVVVDSVYRRMSVSVHLYQEVWSGLIWVIFESCTRYRRSYGKVSYGCRK